MAYAFSHDTSGHVTTYDAATGDDRFVAWNARGLAARIVLRPAAPGTGCADGAATACEAFRHGPDGARYLRRQARVTIPTATSPG